MPVVDPSKKAAASRMVHIAAVTTGWKPATLQLPEEGSSYFLKHRSMAASFLVF